MNTSTQHLADEAIYKSVDVLWATLNQATSHLGHGKTEIGFSRMMQVTEALALFLHFRSGAKDVVCTDEEEAQVVRFPAAPCAQEEDQNALGGPGQVFPCPFIVSHLPRGDIGSLLSTLSAVAAYNMGVACHRESIAYTDYSRRCQFQLRAKQLYMTAYDLLDRLSYISPDGSLIHVYMALCTNLAEMELENGDLDASRKWRVALTNTMACVPDQKESPVFLHFHNTCVFYSFETRAAQAA